MDKEKSKAKSLKLGKDDIICPSCYSVLIISEEIKKDELIQCPKCEAAFSNPFYYSGKFVICANCGNNSELPKDLENELEVNCSICGKDLINPHSDKFNPITCPHCFINVHIPEEIIYERYIICPNCQNDFKNTLRQKKNTSYNTFQIQNINQAICPDCGHNLYIPQEIKNENYIQCLTCGNNFRNPLKPNNGQTLTKTQRNWLIAIAVVIVLWFIGSIMDDNNSSTSSSKVQNSEWDASVYQVEHYLKNSYLKDPDSYEGIEWSKVNKMSGNSEYKYWVRHKYRAKNSFGGYVIENKIFYLDDQGNVVGEKDVY